MTDSEQTASSHHCEGSNCSKPSKLQCPTCKKLGLSPSFFCSQDCFKANWSSHKAKHASAPTSTTPFNPFPNYRFTGSLRPKYPLSGRRDVKDGIKKPDYADTGKPLSELSIRGSSRIEALSKQDQDLMRETCQLAREVLNEGRKLVKPGTTTDEIDRVIHDACMERNCYPSPLNYMEFPKSCCTSVNEVICHGIPDQYELKDGDIVNLDVTAYYNGFHGDLNETYPVGKNVDEKAKKLIKATRECLNKAIEMCKPGVLYRDLGTIIQKTAVTEGFQVVKSYCGHGIHRHFHCAPSIPHYSKNKAVGVMKPGMSGFTFSLKLMLSI